MENKPKISIKLMERFEDGKLVEKFYVIVKETEESYYLGKKLFLSESEFEEFKKVFSDFISKQK